MKTKASFERKEKLKQEARKLIWRNLSLTGGKYIFPASFYLAAQFRWDSTFQAISCASLGLKELAKNEIKQLLEAQREDGFIPGTIYEEKRPFIVNLTNIERRFHSSGKKSLDYPQPPLEAQALEAIDDPDFTNQVFWPVLKGYLYFIQKQDPDSDGLISIVHPHESGRDGDPTFDQLKLKLLGRVPEQLINNYLIGQWASLRLCRKYQKVNWDIKKMWELNLFNVEDVMENTIWLAGMRILERLAPNGEVQAYVKNITDFTEEAIYQLLWDEKEKFFYALDKDHQPIKVETVANLAPLMLPNIPEYMVEALVKRLTDEKKFATPYPIPSVSVSEPSFNPEYPKDPTILKALVKIWSVPGLWRGPNWISATWLIIKGLALQAKRFGNKRYLEIAREIAQRNIKMVEKSGFYEFYHPYTGEGQRARDYAWSTLILTFEEIFDID